MTSKILKSALLESSSQGCGKSATIKIDRNKTELNDTEPSIHPPTPKPSSSHRQRDIKNRMKQMDTYRTLIHENISYSELLRDHPYDADLIDSKVFTFTPGFDTVINADEIITGGAGCKGYTSLPPEAEAMPPDYSIYPHYKRAIGFLTRGCIRGCPWCIVPRKEQRAFARWVNVRSVHKSCTWENYNDARRRIQNGR